MATLKNKRKKKNKIEEASEVLEETVTPKETPGDAPAEEPVYLNEDEQTALAEQHEKDTEEDNNVSFERMTKVVDVVQEEFNLRAKNFAVTGFADKNSKCQVSMSNDDFDIVITIKDTEKFGI